MNQTYFSDFEKVSEVSEDTINKYKGKVPDEIISIWKEYGYCTFDGGYLKVINPDEYIDIVKKSYFLGDISIPIMITAFGDVITWEDNKTVGIVKYRYGDSEPIIDGFDLFFRIAADEEDDEDEELFTIKKYKSALKKYGPLEFDECFGYAPLLGLVGKQNLSNIKKFKIKEHITLIYQMCGEV